MNAIVEELSILPPGWTSGPLVYSIGRGDDGTLDRRAVWFVHVAEERRTYTTNIDCGKCPTAEQAEAEAIREFLEIFPNDLSGRPR
jgi:hypothetical protein